MLTAFYSACRPSGVPIGMMADYDREADAYRCLVDRLLGY